MMQLRYWYRYTLRLAIAHINMIIPALLLVTLLGCTTTYEPEKLAPDWARRWLQDESCRAPCWEGIIPGQTTAADGVLILQNSPVIQSATIITDSFAHELNWTWKDGTSGGRAFFDAQQAPYTVSSFQVTYPGSFRLRDIIAAYGYPSHIIATAHTGGFPGESDPTERSYSIQIVYQPQRFVLSAVTRNQRLVLNEDMQIAAPFFFSDIAALQIRAPEELVPWQGFQSFEFYCRDELGGQICRTTPTPLILQWFGQRPGLAVLLGLLLVGVSIRIWRQKRA